MLDRGSTAYLRLANTMGIIYYLLLLIVKLDTKTCTPPAHHRVDTPVETNKLVYLLEGFFFFL